MSGTVPSLPIATVLPVIADSEVRIASASDVPPATLSRSIAACGRAWSALGWSVVSAAVLERDDADVDAARLGVDERASPPASPRPAGSGATSVAAMLFDTSIATITVPAARVTGTEAAGPAAATRQHGEPGDAEPQPERSRRRAGRRTARPRPAPRGRRRDADAPHRRPAPPRRARRATSHQGESMLMRAVQRVPATTSTSASTRSRSVSIRCSGTPARRIRPASPRRARRRRPGTGRGTAGRWSRRAAARRSRRPRPRSARPRAGRRRPRRPPAARPRRAGGTSRSSGRSHSPVPMKSETTMTSERRRASDATRVEHGGEVGGPAGRPGVRRRPVQLVADPQRVRAGRCPAARRASSRRRAAWRRPGCRRGRTAGPAPGPARPARRACRGPGRAHRHRGRPVEHQPHGQLAVLGELPDLRLVQPGGRVPVDVPGVVAPRRTRAGRRSRARSPGTACGSRPAPARRAGAAPATPGGAAAGRARWPWRSAVLQHDVGHRHGAAARRR